MGWFTRLQLVSAESSDVLHPVTESVGARWILHVRVSALALHRQVGRLSPPSLYPSFPFSSVLFRTILGVTPSSTFQQRSGFLATLPWQRSHGSPTHFCSSSSSSFFLSYSFSLSPCALRSQTTFQMFSYLIQTRTHAETCHRRTNALLQTSLALWLLNALVFFFLLQWLLTNFMCSHDVNTMMMANK